MNVIIEVYKKIPDNRINTLKSDGIYCINEIIDSYSLYLEEGIENDEIKDLANNLINKISEKWRIFTFKDKKIQILESQSTEIKFIEQLFVDWDIDKKYQNDWIIEKSFLPGVKDTLAEVIEEIILQKIGSKKNFVKTSKLFIGNGRIPNLNSFYNPLIEEINFNYAKHKKLIFEDANNLRDSNITGKSFERFTANYESIEKINTQNSLNLNSEQIKAIENYYKKRNKLNISDIEIETIAQTWSEHCKHNIFSYPIDDLKDGIFKTYIRGATEYIMKNNENHICASVFTDNAGAIHFDENHLICVKVETHNSPSALEPFGGAITGILGVNRDIIGFGMGAQPIANYYAFCFDDFDTENTSLYRDEKKLFPKLLTKEIMNGVIKGVNVGGNCSGIPTPQGFMYFSEAFAAKPLVFVGSVGIIPKIVNGKSSCEKSPRDGDLIVIVGGRTGRDGIHGATFSSSAISSDNVKGTEVQIGDPFTQKKLSDAIIKEARDLGLYTAITDNGAGGFSSSIGEMGKNGFVVELDKAPLKSQGLKPWEIWISESQERMTLSVSPENIAKFQAIMEKHDVECSVIGKFNNSGKAIVHFHGEEILNLDTGFLHDGNPTIDLKTTKPQNFEVLEEKQFKTIEEALSDKNICSREFIAKQYDHEVQGNSVLKPLQGENKVFADSTIIKPVLTSDRCLAQSQSLAIISDEPYFQSAYAIEQAIRNIIAVGANPEKIALLDNFCWSDSNNPERLWQLKESARACYDYAIKFSAPFISGKDSMFNDFKGYDELGNKVHIRNFPALLITSVGIVDDIEDAISLDAKFADDLLYILNFDQSIENSNEFYFNYHNLVKEKIIASAITVNYGGRLTAIAKKILAGNFGVKITLDENNLFNKKPEIIVSIAPKNQQKFEDKLKNISYKLIGEVTEDNDFILNNQKISNLSKMIKCYKCLI
jgi:phosphoribosylformylglycinamidine synthase